MAIKYKVPKLETEFKRLPEAVQRVVKELSLFVQEIGAGDVVITCVGRTPEENASVGGAENSLHLDYRACDIRNTEYKEKQNDQINSWLRQRCPKRAYELITKNHGTGPHIHLGLRRA